MGSDKTELNEEQQAAAYCAKNAVVAAGAGSGKTMVLASRYAWLITEKKYRLDQVLALTFTKKAAAQMYRRIYLKLDDIKNSGEPEKSRLAKQALDDFIHARIQTLDSYCASLVKQAAARYGISPDFSIDEDRCHELALEEALPFLISRRHHPAIERLYPQKSPEKIAGDIFANALFNYSYIDGTGDADFLDSVHRQFAIVCDEWKKQRSIITGILADLTGYITENEALHPDLPPLIKRYNSGSVVFIEDSDIRAYFDLLLNIKDGDFIDRGEAHPIQKPLREILLFITELAGLNMSKGKRKDNPVKELIYRLRDPAAGIFSSLAVFCMQAGLVLSIMSLLAELQRRYLKRKRTEGILTFSDTARLARTILIEQPDLRQNEKETFKAIMIDEFQDNNELQKDLLFLISEKPELMNNCVPPASDLMPEKLFFVGDEKQSIYRFRGADVSVFRKLKDELKSASLPLKTNYRSSPALIGAFNAIFGGVDFDPLGKDAPPQKAAVFAPAIPPDGSPEKTALPLYEASYSSLRASPHWEGIKGEGKLTICILDKKSESENENGEAEHLASDSGDPMIPVENEARFTAERILALLAENDETGKPKYRPEDIAILFRSRGPQHLFEKHLRLLNIPYASEDLNGFFFGGVINDIMSVLRLASYPLDTASYAEMLRSPFAGLSLSGLAACMAVFDKAESAGPFTDDPLQYLGEGDRKKYEQGRLVYNLVCEKARSESISSLVSELWYNQGYRYETEWNPQTSVYRELYDYLFHLAVQADADNMGLAAFTDSIQARRDSGERFTDIEIPLERPSAVHLLTVHKSKGLEFPVVFLCCCDKHSMRNTSTDIYETGDAGIAFNPPLPQGTAEIKKIKRNYFWERSLVEEKRKRTAELRRLLYVGMTRAEKELYLSGCLGIGGEIEGDDFSLKLKAFVDEKRAKADNAIPGDNILDNDTFFGLCLPALAEHISEDGLKARPSFFQLEEIPVYTEDRVTKWESRDTVLPNNRKGLNAFFEKTERFYEDIELIKTPDVLINHLTPTSLRNIPADMETVMSKEFSGRDSGDIFIKVDKILARFAKEEGDETEEKFNAASFGTIAHICAEALLKGKTAEIPPRIAGFLSPAEAGHLLEAGTELAGRFLQSPLGETARKAALLESEFPFRSLLKDGTGNETFITGAIDLLFADDTAVHVLDFKTDSNEQPGEHAAQMACYYRAALALFASPAQKECRVWLYYLRTGHAAEISFKRA